METKTDKFPYRIQIGDCSGHAKTVFTDNLAKAEEYANAMLGREWGSSREITVAQICEWNGTEYLFHSLFEF